MLEPQEKIGLRRHLARRLFPVTLVIWLLIGVMFPATYYLIESTDVQRLATRYAQDISERLQALVLESPALWKYRAQEYFQFLNDFLPRKDVTTIRVLDDAGQPLSGFQYRRARVEGLWHLPAVVGSAPIQFNNHTLGAVEVGLSQRSLLRTSLLLALLCSIVGIGLALLAYLYPVRIVAGMERDIQGPVETVQHSNRGLRSLLQASQAVASSLELEEVLQAIVREAASIAGTHVVRLFLLDQAAKVLRCRTGVGMPPEALASYEFPVGEGFSGQVAASGEHLAVPDCRGAPGVLFPEHLTQFNLVSYLGLPVKLGERTLGVLVFNTDAPRVYTQEEIAYLSAFATQAAIAIENARLYAAAEARAAELGALREIGQAIATQLALSAVLEAVADGTMRLLNNPFAQLILWDEATQTLRIGAVLGPGAERIRTQTFALGRGINGTVAQTRQPMVLDDYQASPYAVPECFDVVATITVPILFGDRLLGVLHSHTTQPGRRFTPDDLRRLQMLATQAAIAIENARLYEASQQHAATLEARVRERTAELEGALQVKSQFLANMSHELRTPLNFVLGFAEILRQGTGGPLTPRQATYVDRIQTGGTRLLELVTDLLEMAEMETGPASIQLDRLALTDLLDEVLGPLAVMARARSVVLETALDPGLSVVVADRRKLSRVLHHLTTNAIRFTPGGGRVMVSTRRIRTPEGEEAELTVADTGMGIRPEDRERIFRAFEQVDGSYARPHGGAGLGLALVRRQVELHGGRVWVESEGEGRGARFIVRLPLLPAPPPPRVLLVEDEAPVREALCAALAADGYGVDHAGTGTEALARLAASPPNLLILDIGLPDVDGRELLQRVRADARTRDLPVLILSGLDAVQPDQALTLGADEFLTKPVSAQVLSGTVARLLRRPVRESPEEVRA